MSSPYILESVGQPRKSTTASTSEAIGNPLSLLGAGGHTLLLMHAGQHQKDDSWRTMVEKRSAPCGTLALVGNDGRLRPALGSDRSRIGQDKGRVSFAVQLVVSHVWRP